MRHSHSLWILSASLAAGTQAAPSDWQHSPAAFAANVGQAPADARFVSLTMGYELQITGEGARLVTAEKVPLAINFPGGTRSQPVAAQPLAAKFHHYAGRAAHTDVAVFAQVRQPNVYPGIDAVYYGTQSALEYDFVVQPGADASQIRVRFSGQTQLAPDGSVRVTTGGSDWVQRAPVAYQLVDGERRVVTVRTVLEDGTVRFALGAYDHALALTIDPILELKRDVALFSLLGGLRLTAAADGSFAVAGGADPGLFGDSNIRVAKFGANGALIFFANIAGEERDGVAGLAIDATGAVYAAGTTGSEDLPTTPGAFQPELSPIRCFLPTSCIVQRRLVFSPSRLDAFALKLSPAGQIVWLTYLGSGDFDGASGIALNQANEVYITGTAGGALFPRKNQFQVCRDGGTDVEGSAFLTVLNSSGTDLIYSTCLRPSFPLVTDRFSGATAVAVDASGHAYITGFVNQSAGSDSFPVQGGNGSAPFRSSSQGKREAFAAKFNPRLSGDASLLYSTLLGGTGDDKGLSITVDAQAQACIAGETASSGFPVRSPIGTNTPLNTFKGSTDFFATCLNANASDLLFSNLYGGTGAERAPVLARDAGGNLWLGGFSGSTDITPVNPFNDGTSANSLLVKLTAGSRAVQIQSKASVAIEALAPQGSGLLLAGSNAVHSVLDCTKEITGIRFVFGPFVFDVNSGLFKQTVNVGHVLPASAPIDAGSRLVVSALPPNVQLVNATGVTTCFEPGSPFLDLPAIPRFNQGGVNVTLVFSSATGVITYTPKVTIPVAVP